MYELYVWLVWLDTIKLNFKDAKLGNSTAAALTQLEINYTVTTRY